MDINDRARKILDQVLEHYLKSTDFNGLGVIALPGEDDLEAIKTLINIGKVDMVRGDGHPNPHIKAFEAESPEVQLEKIDENGLEGCLYPTSELLKEREAGAGEAAPYTQALMRGEPQLSFRVFDLRALEWYRNDPRFEFDVDDICTAPQPWTAGSWIFPALALLPNPGPPEAGFFRLFHDDGLVTPSG